MHFLQNEMRCPQASAGWLEDPSIVLELPFVQQRIVHHGLSCGTGLYPPPPPPPQKGGGGGGGGGGFFYNRGVSQVNMCI